MRIVIPLAAIATIVLSIAGLGKTTGGETVFLAMSLAAAAFMIYSYLQCAPDKTSSPAYKTVMIAGTAGGILFLYGVVMTLMAPLFYLLEGLSDILIVLMMVSGVGSLAAGYGLLQQTQKTIIEDDELHRIDTHKHNWNKLTLMSALLIVLIALRFYVGPEAILNFLIFVYILSITANILYMRKLKSGKD